MRPRKIALMRRFEVGLRCSVIAWVQEAGLGEHCFARITCYLSLFLIHAAEHFVLRRRCLLISASFLQTKRDVVKNELVVDRSTLIECTVLIVSAYVSNHKVSRGKLVEFIQFIYSALWDAAHAPGIIRLGQEPAVPINRSVTKDYIVCLEDGRRLKMLKRYLQTQYGFTPEQYRARWGLDADYPMIAPGYAKERSDYAKSIGFGRSDASAPAKRLAASKKKSKPRKKVKRGRNS